MKKDTKKNTKKNTKKYMTGIKIFIILVLVVFFVIIAPFLLNKLYDLGCPFITVWQKEDLIGYYGSIMTAVAAIAGVYFTLDYSKFKQMDDEKMRVKPYLNVKNPTIISRPIDILSVEPEEIYICMFMSLNVVRFSLGDGILPYSLYEIKVTKNNLVEIIQKSFIIRFRVKNIGADSAINIKVILNGYTIINDLSLTKNESRTIKILVVLDNLQEESSIIKFGDIDIRIVYENIFGNEMYEQSGCIKSFTLNKSTGTYSHLGYKQKTPFGKQTILDIEPDNESDIESDN